MVNQGTGGIKIIVDKSHRREEDRAKFANNTYATWEARLVNKLGGRVATIEAKQQSTSRVAA